MKTLHNLDLALDAVYQEAALDFLQDARALLALFNLKRHVPKVTKNGLCLGHCMVWEMIREHKSPLLKTLHEIGDELSYIEENHPRLHKLLEGRTLA